MRADYVDKLANPDQPMHPGLAAAGATRAKVAAGAREGPRTRAASRAGAAALRRGGVQAPAGGQDARLARRRGRAAERHARRPEGEAARGAAARRRAAARGGRAGRAARAPTPAAELDAWLEAHALTSLKGALAARPARRAADVLDSTRRGRAALRGRRGAGATAGRRRAGARAALGARVRPGAVGGGRERAARAKPAALARSRTAACGARRSTTSSRAHRAAALGRFRHRRGARGRGWPGCAQGQRHAKSGRSPTTTTPRTRSANAADGARSRPKPARV